MPRRITPLNSDVPPITDEDLAAEAMGKARGQMRALKKMKSKARTLQRRQERLNKQIQKEGYDWSSLEV